MTKYPKRLIEIDLPIKRISAHSRREKSIRHGHISTLHIWWARRPLAACRAVICAALWLDPADTLTSTTYQQQVANILLDFAHKVTNNTNNLANHCSTENWQKWKVLATRELDINKPEHLNILRYCLLDFIADFANWDNATHPDYLATSRALTLVAHEANGGIPETRPLVVDSFAGGGSIPLEALRVGADAFASDLNPVAVLLNKVVLEYIPKYGEKLAQEVRKWGEWVKAEAEKELGQFYPKDEDGSTPIAYLWARTIISEAPDDGTGIPVEVPLMRSLWLAKKKNRNRALKWVRDEQGQIATEVMEVTYTDGVTRKVRKPVLEIFEPKSAKEVENGTVARGSATCPVTSFTTPVASVRKQLKPRRGGADDARLFCVVTTRESEKGRFYRLPNQRDLDAIAAAKEELEKRKAEYQGELSLVPDEPTPKGGGSGAGRAFSQRNYGMDKFEDLFTSRQALALTTLVRLVNEVGTKENKFEIKGLDEAVQCCLVLAVDRQADFTSAIAIWWSGGEKIQHTFGRQAIPMVWDFCEGNPWSNSTGCWKGAYQWGVLFCEHIPLLSVSEN
jgi:putative DNA methylase